MQQATRLAVAIVGFTVTLLGVVMLVTPGPGWLVILLGLGVLGIEFVWARQLLRRLKKGAAELVCSVFAARKIVDAQSSLPRKDNVHGTGSDSAELRAAIFRSRRVRPNWQQSPIDAFWISRSNLWLKVEA
jgi:Putative transmembrane protein (PGPGW)